MNISRFTVTFFRFWTDARCPIPGLWIRCTEVWGGGGGDVVRRMGGGGTSLGEWGGGTSLGEWEHNNNNNNIL